MAGPWEQYQSGPWEHYQTKPEPAKEETPSNPTGSFMENLAAGAGAGLSSMGRGALQRITDIGVSLGAVPPTVQGRQMAEEAETRKLDAPLMDTWGGKIGNIAAKAAPATAAALVPGGQTLAASIGAGALTGLVEPVTAGESVARNASLSAAGGGIGWGVGRGIGALGERAVQATAGRQVANAGRDAAVESARAAGYSLPPSQINPSATNKILEGMAGKITTAQRASEKNQLVTNRLAAQALGLPRDQQLSKEGLLALRAEAGKAYDAMGGLGTVDADGAFFKAAAKMKADYETTVRQFPSLRKPEVERTIDDLLQPTFDATPTVEALKALRFEGQANKAAIDPSKKALGRVQTQAAEALESLLERSAQQQGKTDLVDGFRAGRQLIAKTYTVEKALNDATGNVRANVLAKQLEKGKPLSGELKKIAQAGQAFPKATQEVNQSFLPISPLDVMATGGLFGMGSMTNSPELALLGAMRPGIRAGIMSPAFQRMAGPSYGPGLLGRAGSVANSPVPRAALGGLGALLLPESQ